jgi:hypothetical protein
MSQQYEQLYVLGRTNEAHAFTLPLNHHVLYDTNAQRPPSLTARCHAHEGACRSSAVLPKTRIHSSSVHPVALKVSCSGTPHGQASLALVVKVVPMTKNKCN